jgi:hypothetical protein
MPSPVSLVPDKDCSLQTAAATIGTIGFGRQLARLRFVVGRRQFLRVIVTEKAIR